MRDGIYSKALVIMVILWIQCSSPQTKLADSDSYIQCVDFNISNVILNNINEIRRKHNSPKLCYSYALSLLSLYYATNFARKGDSYLHKIKAETFYVTDQFQYDKPTDFGAVDRWYEQRLFYQGYYDPARLCKYEYFTQMVWKDTLDIGCQACNNSKKMYIICLYFPEGNIIDGFVKNVDPPYAASSASVNYIRLRSYHIDISFFIIPMVFLLKSVFRTLLLRIL